MLATVRRGAAFDRIMPVPASALLKSFATFTGILATDPPLGFHP